MTERRRVPKPGWRAASIRFHAKKRRFVRSNDKIKCRASPNTPGTDESRTLSAFIESADLPATRAGRAILARKSSTARQRNRADKYQRKARGPKRDKYLRWRRSSRPRWPSGPRHGCLSLPFAARERTTIIIGSRPRASAVARCPPTAGRRASSPREPSPTHRPRPGARGRRTRRRRNSRACAITTRPSTPRTFTTSR